MTLRIDRRPLVREDLLDVWGSIAVDDEAAADRVLDRIERVLGMLAEHPRAGRARPEIGGSLRSFPALCESCVCVSALGR